MICEMGILIQRGRLLLDLQWVFRLSGDDSRDSGRTKSRLKPVSILAVKT